VLGLPAAHIRVIATPNGGGFGGKSDPFNHEIVAAKDGLLLGRPVKICADARGGLLLPPRPPPGADADPHRRRQRRPHHRQHLQTLLDGGAYGSYGVASTYYTGALQTVTYDLPRYRFDGCRAFTNKPPCGPKRGHGTPQPRFGFEVQLDKAAERAGLDPAELRLRIISPPTAVTANWLRIGTIGLARVHRGGGRRQRLGRKAFRRCRAGEALGLACGRTCAAPGCRSTGTTCRTPACSSSSTAAAA
jgi:4-hydroxybenzoyl-CoA reductase subunit alpha